MRSKSTAIITDRISEGPGYAYLRCTGSVFKSSLDASLIDSFGNGLPIVTSGSTGGFYLS